MSHVEIETSTVIERFRTARRSRRPTAKGVLSCMVVSTDVNLCDLLQNAAGKAGWKVDVFADAPKAQEAARHSRFRLALIDVSYDGALLSHVDRELCRSFARQKGNLLVVCGKEDDAEVEIWARSVGAWVHLAGPGSLSGLTKICHEAAQLVSRWTKVEHVPVAV